MHTLLIISGLVVAVLFVVGGLIAAGIHRNPQLVDQAISAVAARRGAPDSQLGTGAPTRTPDSPTANPDGPPANRAARRAQARRR